MPRKIQIIINPKTGEREFEIQGVIGAKCTDLSTVLARDQEVKDEQYTEDYYTPQTEPQFVEDL